MSLILEALRKSEAERRRGQVPTLHAERAPVALAAPAARRAWPWLAMAILAVLATAWLARGAWSPPPRAAAATDAPARSVAAPAAIRDSYPRDAGAGQRDAGATVPVESTRRPADPSAPAPVADIATSPPAAIPPRTDAPPPQAGLAGTATAGGAGGAASDVARVPPRTAIPAVAAAAPPAPAPDATIAPAPLRLSDLSPAERLELPPLKMSMHMWDPTPAHRFAIIDGARVNEGDRLGEAVVDEITASEVVLAWRGQRLQIPLR